MDRFTKLYQFNIKHENVQFFEPPRSAISAFLLAVSTVCDIYSLHVYVIWFSDRIFQAKSVEGDLFGGGSFCVSVTSKRR